jgi:hypothetical protein
MKENDNIKILPISCEVDTLQEVLFNIWGIDIAF